MRGAVTAALALSLAAGLAAQQQPGAGRTGRRLARSDRRAGHRRRGRAGDRAGAGRLRGPHRRRAGRGRVGAWLGATEPARAPLASTGFTAVLAPRDRRQLVVFFVQKSLEADRAQGLLRLLQDSDRLLAGWPGRSGGGGLVRAPLQDLARLHRRPGPRARGACLDVMHEDPHALEPQAGLSIVAGIDQAEGRKIWQVEDRPAAPRRGARALARVEVGGLDRLQRLRYPAGPATTGPSTPSTRPAPRFFRST